MATDHFRDIQRREAERIREQSRNDPSRLTDHHREQRDRLAHMQAQQASRDADRRRQDRQRMDESRRRDQVQREQSQRTTQAMQDTRRREDLRKDEARKQREAIAQARKPSQGPLSEQAERTRQDREAAKAPSRDVVRERYQESGRIATDPVPSSPEMSGAAYALQRQQAFESRQAGLRAETTVTTDPGERERINLTRSHEAHTYHADQLDSIIDHNRAFHRVSGMPMSLEVKKWSDELAAKRDAHREAADRTLDKLHAKDRAEGKAPSETFAERQAKRGTASVKPALTFSDREKEAFKQRTANARGVPADDRCVRAAERADERMSKPSAPVRVAHEERAR